MKLWKQKKLKSQKLKSQKLKSQKLKSQKLLGNQNNLKIKKHNSDWPPACLLKRLLVINCRPELRII